jgi:hypothetical protein
MIRKIVLTTLVCLTTVATERSSGQAQQQPQDQQRQQTTPAQPPARQYEFRERYEILNERNIFLRNRSRPQRNATTNPSTGSSTQSSRRPEQLYTLTGIILEEGRRLAFIENMTTGTTERLAVGAAVAGGKIVDVDFHHLEFETGAGQRVNVEVGRTLSGGSRDAAAAVVATQPSSAQIDPSNPNLSREERLRLRRQQELGK